MKQKMFYIIVLLSVFSVSADVYGHDTIVRHVPMSDTFTYLITNIRMEGNKVTKEEIIFRELSLEMNHIYSSVELEKNIVESRENLLNTQLFNFVDIERSGQPDSLEINIRVVERWYIWPVPLFEHAARNLPTFLKNPDFKKINYGLQLNWHNFRGMKEELSFKARLGYKEQFSLIYFKPNIDRDQKHGFGFGYNLFRQHEVRYKTFNNEPQYLRNEDDYVIETITADLAYVYRPKIHLKSSISLHYHETLFRNDSLHFQFLGVENDRYLRNFNLALNTTIERRDKVAYPLRGYMINFNLLQRGLGIISDYPYSKTIITIQSSHYHSLTKRLFLENAAKIRMTANELQPYFLREAIGGSTYLRGFEYYLIDGNSYLLSVNSLKYNLLSEIEQVFKWIPLEQFNRIHYSLYAKLFLDAAYVSSPFYEGTADNLSNTWLYSTGIGFDLVSYYDQVFRLEFTRNSLGQFGVFLHVETVFKRW